ncbi:non-homologous end-joining DNA ligase [Paenibacillus prosopidis]|uniref:Bifunctional non-homologous end joining protein LigD n=1 Tax=Paenibacillus prosopidis TaxID=630520 RepID=A0A368W343_9BACL|nr:non-homologous end-joining DNA ligase [Paenibacillus prosopidis]RCW49130.1 bifunctional non-homologous end joining protein LigD [Paenibacillus prosopidis]
MIKEFEFEVEGHTLRITNPEKLLWPEAEITKLDYIKYLIEMAPYLLSYAKDRLLTTIRYPNGIHGKSFYQKNLPAHAPAWVATHVWRDTNYILANDIPTLVWLGNQACLELHVSFNLYYQPKLPTELVFDLDPTDVDNFSLVLEVALRIKEVLDSLGLVSQPKTSGASGLQIYIPLEVRYTYEQTRSLNKFIAQYTADKYPQLVTVERLVKNRGTKLYFDYIQHGEGRTLPAPYSPRARKEGSVSTPVTWEEVRIGFSPRDFTIKNVKQRVDKMGDFFVLMTKQKAKQSIDQLLQFIK